MMQQGACSLACDEAANSENKRAEAHRAEPSLESLHAEIERVVTV